MHIHTHTGTTTAAERRNKINQPATPTPKKTSTVHIIRVGSLRTHDDQPVRRHTNGSNQAEPKKPIIVTPVSRDAADETLPPAITSDNVAETLSGMFVAFGEFGRSAVAPGMFRGSDPERDRMIYEFHCSTAERYT